MFIDRVAVQFAAGKGGNGIVAWRREKYIPKGGPCGGNGGKGGNIILQSDSQVFSLEWFRNRRIMKAADGKAGAYNNRQGGQGEDLILKVPCGTLVSNPKSGEILHDFTADKEQWTLC